MKITKLGHCCLLIEEAGLRILTDPGMFTVEEVSALNVDLVLITHEHPDHLHMDSVKKILTNSPKVQVVTNTAVGKILAEAGISFGKIENGQSEKLNGLVIEGYGDKHEEIYEEYGQVQNTGFFINNKLFYPGDALTNPGKPIEILALPAIGPWVKTKDAIKYALELNPKHCFPVHDGIVTVPVVFHMPLDQFLNKNKINFNPLTPGQGLEI